MREKKTGLALSLAVLVFALSASKAFAQDPNEVVEIGRQWRGARGVTVKVADIMKRPQPMPSVPTQNKLEEKDDLQRMFLPPHPDAKPISQWPPLEGRPPKLGGGLQMKISFHGGNSGTDSNAIPPDTEGAVGPSQILMTVNGRVRVFDKGGNMGALNTTTNTFFASVRGTSGTSDPRARYDKLSQRWFVVMINVSNPNRVLLAVSSGPVINDQSSFTFYQFTQDQVAPAGDTGGLFDYPSLGVDANAIYVGGNMFNSSYTGSPLFVINKASVMSGGPIVVSAFRNIGMSTPMGVDNDDPNPTAGFVIGNGGSSGQLVIRKILNAGTAPAITGAFSVFGPSTASPMSQAALGSTRPLDSLGDRLFGAQIRLNRLTGQRSLWTSHNIRVNSSGVGSSGGDRNGARWYQIGNLDGTPALVQAGTVFSANAGEGRWIDSITSNGQGHALLGCSAAGPNRRAEIVAAYRLSTDPLGTMRPDLTIQTSATNYNVQTSGTQRWGDYSHMDVDPEDDMTMWGFQEYCSNNNQWGIRIFSVQAPPPAQIASVTPPTLAPGQTATLTVTGTSVDGSGFFDPGPGFPKRLQAALGAGITVDSVSFVNPTLMTVDVTVASNAAAGPRSLTVTNPDGQTSFLANAVTVADAVVVVPPTSYQGSRGSYVSGGVPELALSDNTYLVYRAGSVLSSSESPVDINFTGTSTLLNPSSLTFRLEARANTPNIRQVIFLWNVTSGGWEEVDARSAALADTPIDITISSDPGRFVAGDGTVRARVAFKANGSILTYPWSISIDQAVWRLNP